LGQIFKGGQWEKKSCCFVHQLYFCKNLLVGDNNGGALRKLSREIFFFGAIHQLGPQVSGATLPGGKICGAPRGVFFIGGERVCSTFFYVETAGEAIFFFTKGGSMWDIQNPLWIIRGGQRLGTKSLLLILRPDHALSY